MSRAFVKEDVGGGDVLPERPISPHRNLVTASGLAKIDAEIDRLRAALRATSSAELQASPHARDLRYWLARRTSAELVPQPSETGVVRFGSSVVIDRDGGQRQCFRIVGEDEADPKAGTLSYVSPLARALLGREAGEALTFGQARLSIIDAT